MQQFFQSLSTLPCGIGLTTIQAALQKSTLSINTKLCDICYIGLHVIFLRPFVAIPLKQKISEKFSDIMTFYSNIIIIEVIFKKGGENVIYKGELS